MSTKFVLLILAAFVLGAAMGTFLSRPPQVKAASSMVNLQKVEEGNNPKTLLSGSRYLGFACTQTDCYLATTD
jgi:hypothetical protein